MIGQWPNNSLEPPPIDTFSGSAFAVDSYGGAAHALSLDSIRVYGKLPLPRSGLMQ